MFLGIKNKLESELKNYILDIDKLYFLSRLSPVLYNNIKEFISRKGKRIRPILFIIGYLGFAKDEPSGLYRSALSLELLHDFMLVHDDIIDKSSMRRGRPSMHEMLNRHLTRYRSAKISGADLTIVIGDVMFAMSLHAFLSIKENPARKEHALKRLIEAALYTGSGEFSELLYGLEDIDKITKKDTYNIYDYKTANYTFASPLAIGATLAGASPAQIQLLFKYGINLGRAFQINDDILGLFGEEKNTGKSGLCDLQEAKKTVLMWYAYNHSGPKERAAIKRILSKKKVTTADLLKMREICVDSGALKYAQLEINTFKKKAQSILSDSRIQPGRRESLNQFSAEILKLTL